MADSSILTLGTARSLLVDSSVCETTKDQVFLGVMCEDGEGKCIISSLFSVIYYLSPLEDNL